MLYCLIGESSCGKSTIENKMREMYNMEKVLQFTDRPKREGEAEGISYHFVSRVEFENMIDNSELDDYELFHTKKGSYYYGLTIGDIEYDQNDYVLTTNPYTYNELINKYGNDNITCIYLYVPEHIRLLRQINRNDEPSEIFRRFKADKRDYEDSMEIADYTICNTDIEKTLKSIDRIVR